MDPMLPEKLDDLLSGVKIVDLTENISGPYCTKLFSGLGAEVLKVERPGQGDPSRQIGPFPQDAPDLETSALFLYLNTNKKSITLNLESQTGVLLLRQLVSQADVLVESFQPGELAAKGLDYETLAKTDQRLVMTSVSNFGQDGPYKKYKANELVLYGMSGLMYITGEPEREPLMLGVPMAQYVTGQHAFVATLGAIYYQELTGKGNYVDVSAFECNAGLLEFQLSQYLFQNHVPCRVGFANEKGHPHGLFPCKDGWVAISAWADAGWKSVVKITGIQELDDPRFSTQYGRVQFRDEIDAYLLPWLLQHDGQEICEAWQKAGLPASRLHDIEDLLRSPHLQERNYFSDIDHPVAGKLPYPQGPFRIKGRSWKAERAPFLGEHNREFFCDRLGYTAEDLLRLRSTGII